MNEIDVEALDGRPLQLFCDIYDLGSVSKAAEKRGVNQSTASYSLDRLRSILGDPLFLRTGRNIFPTEYTHRIIPKVRMIIGDMEGLLSHTAYDPHGDEGEIRIYLNVNELLPEARRIYQEIRTNGFTGHVKFLELGSRDDIASLLHSGKADLIISVRPQTQSSVAETLPLGRDRLACFISLASFCQ